MNTDAGALQLKFRGCLAGLARGRLLREKDEELKQALRGLVGPHQRMLIAAQLEHIDFLDRQIASLDLEIAKRMRPFEEVLAFLDTIPGAGRRIAEQIVAEIGTDMERFPTAAHLASWAGRAPGKNESAGKRKSGRTRKGNKALRATLTEAARSAARTKATYLSASYHRIAARRGANRAALAIGHAILVIAYHILTRRQPYVELGPDYLDERKKQAMVRRTVKKLQNLGYEVRIEPKVAQRTQGPIPHTVRPCQEPGKGAIEAFSSLTAPVFRAAGTALQPAGASDDRLPPRLFREPLGPDWLTEEEFSVMLAYYYSLRGWEAEGHPAGAASPGETRERRAGAGRGRGRCGRRLPRNRKQLELRALHGQEGIKGCRGRQRHARSGDAFTF